MKNIIQIAKGFTRRFVLFVVAIVLVTTVLAPLSTNTANAETAPNVTAEAKFNSGGLGFNDYVITTQVQSDGKTLAGGRFTAFNGVTQNRLIRLNTDATKDTTFDVGLGFDEVVNSIAIQPDNKILVGGGFWFYNDEFDSQQFGLVRLNPDGSRDTSFNTGTGFDNGVQTIAIQPDNKILVGGWSTVFNGTTQNYLVRLNPDGSRDTSFNTGTGFDNGVQTIAIQPDNKILVGGLFTAYNGTTQNYLVRLNPDGTKDTSFDTGTGLIGVGGEYVYTIAIQSDNKILVGGQFTNYNGATQNCLVRLNPDGSKDTSFDIGTGFDSDVSSIAVQPDNKVLVVGYFTTYNGNNQKGIIRLNTDGSKDANFNIGTGLNNEVTSVSVNPDNKILVSGGFTSYNDATQYNLARINPDGSKDTTFNIGTALNNTPYAVAIQTDNKILVGGNFTAYNGYPQNRLVRLNPDGTKDTSFNIGIGFSGIVYSIALQTDNKILVGGAFGNFKGVAQSRLIRLNPDGTKDTTFNIGTGFNSPVYSIAIQPDNKILVAGSFITYQGVTQNRLIRLNPDGSKDTSFDIVTGFDNSVQTMAIQNDNKIVLGGYFSTYQGVTQNRLIRLNSDGSKDSSFGIGTGLNNTAYSMALQPDNKILVGGYFTTFNGSTQNYLVRLNPDGSKDTSFNIGTGFDNYLFSLALQPDNKIILGGKFTSFNGVTQNRLIRLNSDGSKDTTFDAGTGFNDIVYSVALQPDNKI